VLHWKSGHKIACKERARRFALFNIRTSRNLMPVDNEPKHGGVQSRFAALAKRLTSMKKKEKRFDQLRSAAS
jgi:hypothetical protein